VTGLVIGVTEVALASSFGALIFSGRLASRLPAGIGLVLFGEAACALLVALGSSIRGVVSTSQDSPAAVVALMAAAVAGRFAVGSEEAFLTVVALIAVTTIATGLFLLVVGTFRLGDLSRFIPHPVMGGFLAGTGWLLVKGGFSITTGTSLTWSTLGSFTHTSMLARWVPAVAFAAVVTVLTRRWHHPLLLPAAVVAGAGLFYAVLAGGGWSIAQARTGGWLPVSFPGGQLWHPWTWSAVSTADWSKVLAQAATLPSLLVVSLVALLLNLSGIELSLGRDVEVNRELRVTGLANVVAGIGGGTVCFPSVSVTVLAHNAKAHSRWVGVTLAAVCVLAIGAGAGVVALIPNVLLGALIIFYGLGMLWEWVVDAATELPFAEYLVVILIVGVVAAAGFLAGVAVGVVSAVVLFAVNYSRTDVVKHALSGRTYQSKAERRAGQTQLLRDSGDQIFIMELQGFVFFGTAHSLLQRMIARARARDLDPLRFLIVDFRQVSGLDSSAAMSFTRAWQLARSEGFMLVLTDLSPSVSRVLRHLISPPPDGIEVFADLDRGLEWCEDQLLSRDTEESPTSHDDGLRAQLARGLPVDVEPERFLAHLERVEVPAHHRLIRQGDPSDELYFLESGRLTVILEPRGGADGEIATDGALPTGMRLRTMGPGAVVGELALYLGTPRTASVVTETPSVVYRLSRGTMDQLADAEPALAAALHRLFAVLLAERLADTLRTVEALLR
jgi:sulfate permease, SulP family